MSFDGSGIHIGSILVGYFGLIIVVAVAASGLVIHWLARRRGAPAGHVADLLAWMLVSGIIAARLFYIWNPPPSAARYYDRAWYLSHPLDLQAGPLALWSGGLGMAGVLAGAVLGAVYIIWRRGLDLPRWADILVPGAALSLVIAPWANLVTGQMAGPPTSLPWGIRLDYLPPGYDDPALYSPGTTRFHPTPAYLSLWALAVFLTLIFVARRRGEQPRNGEGALLGGILLLSGLFLADFLRVDVNRGILGITGMQTLSALGLVILITLAARHLVAKRRLADRSN